MQRLTTILKYGYWVIAALLFAGGVVLVFAWTPTEATMGPVQKIFYLHLPAAINTFLALMVCFIASVGYLWKRQQQFDDLALAGAKVGVLRGSLVLLTGMLWSRSAWGTWWTWSPRLTFSLVLWLLYTVYLVIRPSIEGQQRRAMISAVYGIVAFVDVPLVYLSVKLMPDIHPTSIALAPAMQWTLGYWFLPITMINIGLLAVAYRLHRREALLARPRTAIAVRRSTFHRPAATGGAA